MLQSGLTYCDQIIFCISVILSLLSKTENITKQYTSALSFYWKSVGSAVIYANTAASICHKFGLMY